jgi:hypothetical protein
LNGFFLKKKVLTLGFPHSLFAHFQLLANGDKWETEIAANIKADYIYR